MKYVSLSCASVSAALSVLTFPFLFARARRFCYLHVALDQLISERIYPVSSSSKCKMLCVLRLRLNILRFLHANYLHRYN
jgi:hypothetical protein